MTVLGRPGIIIRKCKDALYVYQVVYRWCIPDLFLRCVHINCSLLHLQTASSTGFLSLYSSRGVKAGNSFLWDSPKFHHEINGTWVPVANSVWGPHLDTLCLTQAVMPSTPCWLAPRCSVDRRHSALGGLRDLYSACMEFVSVFHGSKMLSGLVIVTFTKTRLSSRTLEVNFASLSRVRNTKKGPVYL